MVFLVQYLCTLGHLGSCLLVPLVGLAGLAGAMIHKGRKEKLLRKSLPLQATDTSSMTRLTYVSLIKRVEKSNIIYSSVLPVLQQAIPKYCTTPYYRKLVGRKTSKYGCCGTVNAANSCIGAGSRQHSP